MRAFFISLGRKGDKLLLYSRYENKTQFFLTNFPTLMDPADRHYVYVGASTIPSTGEGLFARRDIPMVNNDFNRR